MTTSQAISVSSSSPSAVSSESAASSLHNCCVQGDLQGLKVLLEENSSLLSEQDATGRLPIHNALMHANVDCVRELLTREAAVQDYRGWPAAHLSLALAGFEAYREDCLASLQALISAKIDISGRDKRKRTILHFACASNLSSVVPLLLGLIDLRATDKEGLQAIHYAVDYDARECLALLLQELGSEVMEVEDERGDKFIHRAVRKGMWGAAQALVETFTKEILRMTNKADQNCLQVAQSAGLSSEFASFSSGQVPASHRKFQTLIVTHPLCCLHGCLPTVYSEEERIRLYQSEFQPENPSRYEVLLKQPTGALLVDEFADNLLWMWEPPPACIVDILRVHEYGYVHYLKTFCEELEESLGAVCLDRDTLVSAQSYDASLRAAGAVIAAIDEVVSGRCRNAFCPVRPPGHHVGPSGLVRSSDPDDQGSNGFCLLNNIAIGAAYALSILRDVVHKVAIVDFDIHHGNGTEAIISSLSPIHLCSTRDQLNLHFSMHLPSYRPWLGSDDKYNVLYISTHGYGDHFYPGSGTKSTDVREGPGGVLNLPIPSDSPSSDFHKSKNHAVYSGVVFPRLLRFEPDLILVSAGFDAHIGEEINGGFGQLDEADYAWVTEELVKVANTCCDGRIGEC